MSSYSSGFTDGGDGKWSPSTPHKIWVFNVCFGGIGSEGGNFGFSCSFYSSGVGSGFGGKCQRYILIAKLWCFYSSS